MFEIVERKSVELSDLENKPTISTFLNETLVTWTTISIFRIRFMKIVE